MDKTTDQQNRWIDRLAELREKPMLTVTQAREFICSRHRTAVVEDMRHFARHGQHKVNLDRHCLIQLLTNLPGDAPSDCYKDGRRLVWVLWPPPGWPT